LSYLSTDFVLLRRVRHVWLPSQHHPEVGNSRRVEGMSTYWFVDIGVDSRDAQTSACFWPLVTDLETFARFGAVSAAAAAAVDGLALRLATRSCSVMVCWHRFGISMAYL
jgi:hypothetical protein